MEAPAAEVNFAVRDVDVDVGVGGGGGGGGARALDRDVTGAGGLVPSLPWSVATDAAAIVAAVESAVDDVGTASAATSGPASLTDQERAILDFERLWWKRPGAKEQAIRDHFEISPTRYYQTLNALLDHPHALTYDAALVNRLQRLRASTLRMRRLA